ncbi:retrovirus-related Pol polyprotein from transposon 297 [Trichonephila clavipes]|nr:retrovirus-related Pol polyprotein from transposon 297 [Trichonephila clavipes]
MLATELGLAPSDNLKIIELKDLITNSDRYDEEFVKDVLSVIVKERTAIEKQKAVELEEKQKAVVVAQQREREFELEKMQIQLEMLKLSQAPVTSQQLENPKLKLNIIIPRFNSNEDEMGLYLTIFERQAKFLNIPKKTWTANLIGSLPPDIAQLIAREDEAQNYEKIKRKTPANIKEHFLDIWVDLNDLLELAEKLEAYDSLRPGMKSNPNYTFKKKDEFRKPFPIKKSQPVGSRDNHSPVPSRTVPGFPSYKTKGRNPTQCYGCGTPGVVKSKCPTCTRANEMERAVNCMTLFNLNSNWYPTNEFRKPFPIKKSQPVGSRDNHSPVPSRTVPGFPSYKTKGRNPTQCYGCGTPGVVKSKCPTCTRANEMERAVNCMTLFNLNSNWYPTSVIVLKIFGEKIAVFVDIGASHTVAEKMFKFLQEHDVSFTNKRISFMMVSRTHRIFSRGSGVESSPFLYDAPFNFVDFRVQNTIKN